MHLLRRDRIAERCHLHGERKCADRLHVLRRVGNHDHVIGGVGNDLLAQQRRAAALDQHAAGACLVRAVHGQMDAVDLLERDQRHAEAAREVARLHARLDAAHDQPVGNLVGQKFHEILRGRARAEADGHAVLDKLHRRGRRILFLGFVGHLPALNPSCPWRPSRPPSLYGRSWPSLRASSAARAQRPARRPPHPW